VYKRQFVARANMFLASGAGLLSLPAGIALLLLLVWFAGASAGRQK